MFWSRELEGEFEGPEAGNLVVFEAAPAGATLSWSFVSRGAPGSRRSAQRWRLDAADAPAIIGALTGFYGVAADAFGAADASLNRASGPAPALQALQLPGGPGVALAAGCCDERTYPTAGLVLSAPAFVLSSNLQAAFVGAEGDLTAWVTDSQGEGRPVQGARVALYFSPSNGQGPAVAGPSCTTAADGTCSIDAATLSAARGGDVNSNANRGSLREVSALVTAPGQGPLIVPRVSTQAVPWRAAGPGYTGAVALDRGIVRPGDGLAVAAFIQRVRGAQRLPPGGLARVLLRVTPGFEAGGGNDAGGGARGARDAVVLSAPLDARFGTAQAKVPVPAAAIPGEYTVSVLAPRADGGVRRVGGGGGGIMIGEGFAGDDGGGSAQPLPVAIAESAPAVAARPAARGLLQAPQARGAGAAFLPGPAPPAGDGATDAGYETVASAAFAVADPRPPTADLLLTAPNWAKPRDRVGVALKATSYVGTSVAGAELTLAWELPRAKGNVTLTTDARGAANATIDLGALPRDNATAAGDALELKATWIGPTREAIVRSRTVRIADGPARLEISTTLDTDLPGVRFGVAVDAFSNDVGAPASASGIRSSGSGGDGGDGDDDAARLDGTTVTVTMAPANASAGATNCTAAQLFALRQNSAAPLCTIKAGDTAASVRACQLALPCAGEFVVRACAGASCANLTLGRNASEWRRAPWAAQPRLKALADRRRYRTGQPVALLVQNPYAGPASALVVWGNRVARRQKAFARVPPGAASLALGPAGAECQGGCSATIVFAVARAVPTSKLFDPLAPHTPTATAGIVVVDVSWGRCWGVLRSLNTLDAPLFPLISRKAPTHTTISHAVPSSPTNSSRATSSRST